MACRSKSISGSRMTSAAPAMPASSASHPAWRPMVSTIITRWWLLAVLSMRRSASVAVATAVSKPKLRSQLAMSLSMVVGVPKTIDNDIANCERSFGFDTAVATATEALRRIESTANSHHRVMIVETMGRHAGWLALEAGIAGAADVILLPEIDFDLQAIVDFCRGREQRQRYTIICIGEGAKESGASLTVRERIEQSPDPVRLGGVGHVLRERLQPHLRSEVRTTVLRHVQRGGDPTPFY